MFSKNEKQVINKFIQERPLASKIINIQNTQNKSSFEAFYEQKMDEEWKDLFTKAVNKNLDFRNFCDKEIDYFIIPRSYFFSKIRDYVESLNEYIKKGNYNTMILITSTTNKYKKIIKFLNENNILCFLVTSDREDIYLNDSNLFVLYTSDIKSITKGFKKLYKIDSTFTS